MEAMHELDDIVADYISRYQERAEKELRWFSIQRTLEDAVRISALAKSPSGKRLSHQRRIPESVLRESHRNLLDGLSVRQETKSFEQLDSLVASMIERIPDIGQLTVYDTSLRIGAYLGLEPGIVLLHAGTREGARRLGLDVTREFLTVEELPRALRRLRPREIEDILCIYKSHFAGGQKVSSQMARCHR